MSCAPVGYGYPVIGRAVLGSGGTVALSLPASGHLGIGLGACLPVPGQMTARITSADIRAARPRTRRSWGQACQGSRRHGSTWRAGGERLQWTFRLHLLPPVIRVQPARRYRAVCPAAGQRAQRRQLARGAGAGGGSLPGHGEAALFPRRCGFRQSRDIRVPRSRRRRLHDPASSQPGLAGQDRLSAQASGRTAAA